MASKTPSQLPLRMTHEERAMVETVRDVYSRYGVQMSLNETVRHLIRRGGLVCQPTLDGARAAEREHAEGCDACTADVPGCADGLYLHRHTRRMMRAAVCPDPAQQG